MKLGSLIILLAPLAWSAGHRVLEVMPLPGQGGSDALLVDSAARRLYVARSNHLLVLDVDSRKQLADIIDLPAIAGIAIAPGIDRGYVTSSADNRVNIFALSDFGHLGGIRLGSNPGALVYDAAAHRFYALNRGSNNASAIDADDGEVERTLDLGGRPGGAVDSGDGRVFVTVEGRNEVVQIDAAKMAIKSRWPVATCETPHGIAFDDRRHLLFIGCSNRALAILEAEDGALVGMVKTGEGGGDIVADSSSGLVYLANRDGSVSVLSEGRAGKYEITETVPTERGATALALDSATHHLFVLAPASQPPVRSPDRKPAELDTPGPSQLLIIGR
jgi:DNA-binding beta-propeller fold protein YncE